MIYCLRPKQLLYGLFFSRATREGSDVYVNYRNMHSHVYVDAANYLDSYLKFDCHMAPLLLVVPPRLRIQSVGKLKSYLIGLPARALCTRRVAP